MEQRQLVILREESQGRGRRGYNWAPLFSAFLEAAQGFQLKQINDPALLGPVFCNQPCVGADRDPCLLGNITQQRMTFLIRGPEESEIGSSLVRPPGLLCTGLARRVGCQEWTAAVVGISWPSSLKTTRLNSVSCRKWVL